MNSLLARGRFKGLNVDLVAQQCAQLIVIQLDQIAALGEFTDEIRRIKRRAKVDVIDV